MSATPSVPDGRAGTIRVFYVDDQPELADPVATALEKEDERLSVETAASVAEGLERLAGERFDCVVSDYELPDRDGIEFLEAVRDDDPDLPFVLYTGSGGEGVASEAISAGVTDYLRKGGGADQHVVLANRVRNAVERYRSRRTRRRQNEAIESAREAIGILDGDGEFVYVNRAYADLYGYEPEELLGEHWELIYPDDVSVYRDEIRSTVASEGHWHGETTGLRADGSTFPADHVVSRTPRGDLVSTVRDLSDRRERESELRMKTRAMDEAPIGITTADPAGDDNPLTYVNEHFEELTGYDREDVLGRNCRFLQGEGTASEPVAEMREAIDAAEPVEVELRNYRTDGTEFWNRVQIAPVRDEAGDVDHYVGFQQDVTERKEYERRLREEHAFIEQSLDALEDVFYVFSADGETLRWNERLPAVTGYTDEEIATMEPTDFFPDDHVQRVAEAVEEVTESGQATVQADYLTKDGERIPHEFTGFRLTDPDGEVMGFAGIGRDLRQRREYERQLEQRNERLEEFASIVSHDLRNPLNVAEGHLDLARDDCDSQHLETVADAHARIEELIEELLTLAKEGTIALDPGAVSLTDVARASWGTVGTGTATLSVDQEVMVRADESRLRQLLENLFRNAVEHGEEGVTVRIGALDGGDGFYVADDGPGIPEDERERVFDSGVTTGEEGIGAGLSIVQRVADAHSWDVAVTDSESGGARFEVTGLEGDAE